MLAYTVTLATRPSPSAKVKKGKKQAPGNHGNFRCDRGGAVTTKKKRLCRPKRIKKQPPRIRVARHGEPSLRYNMAKSQFTSAILAGLFILLLGSEPPAEGVDSPEAEVQL